MKKIAIVGYGRFGALLAQLASSHFAVHIVETNDHLRDSAQRAGFKTFELAGITDMDYIFLAVPIASLEAVLTLVAPLVTEQQVVIDLCSVKTYPAQLMQTHLPNCQLLASHPMFGPDSARYGLDGLQVALCPLRIDPANLKIITDFWTHCGATTQETTPDEHDQDVIYSQAFTYTIAKIILAMDLSDITFTTRSFKAITEVAALSAKDSEQLFHDMLFYNPYFPALRTRLETALAATVSQLDTIQAEQTDTNQPA